MYSRVEDKHDVGVKLKMTKISDDIVESLAWYRLSTKVTWISGDVVYLLTLHLMQRIEEENYNFSEMI